MPMLRSSGGCERVPITDQCAVNQHLATILPLNPCHHAQRGRFPTPRGAQQAGHLPRFKPQADIIHPRIDRQSGATGFGFQVSDSTTEAPN